MTTGRDGRRSTSEAPLFTPPPSAPVSDPSGSPPSDVSATWAVEPAIAPVVVRDPSETLMSPGGSAKGPVVVDPSDGTTMQVARAPEEPASSVRPSQPAGADGLGVTREHEGRYAVPDDAVHSELGRGGIGRVFAARDRHLDREVAVKELLPAADEHAGVASQQAMTRFLREARVTGKLEHPNIVPVHELGQRADGTLYYTMRVVRGRTLASAIATAKNLRERLSLVNHFSGLCQAIAYAHSRGVVHRDVKPANVMIGEFGETVVLDWGTAKLQARDPREGGPPESSRRVVEPSDTDVTVEGGIYGTPIYMSPEQAFGRVEEVDERSDVWALGVVLYTILAGRPPFGGDTFTEVRRQLQTGSYVPLSQVDGEIPPELAAIVERALRRAASERYPTAREMAKDVQAYQAGERVTAYEYSSLELLKRFLARERNAVVASGAGLLAMLVLSLASYGRVVAARDRALLAERRALDDQRSALASAQAARRSLSEMLVEKAQLAQVDGDTISSELLAAHALDLEERPDARGIVLAAESSMRPVPISTLEQTAGCDRYATAPRGGLLACAKGPAVRVWDVRESKVVWSSAEGTSDVVALAMAPEGGTLAAASAAGDLYIFRLGKEPFLASERKLARVSSIGLSPDGKVAAAGSSGGGVLAWETEGAGREWRFFLGQAVSALAFAPGSTDLALGGELGAVSLWNWQSDKELKVKGHSGTVRAFAFSGEGRLLASGGADRALRFWDTQDGRSLFSPIAHEDAITSIAWSSDARWLVFGGQDKSFRLLDPRGSGHGVEVRRHIGAVELVALSPERSELATVDKDAGLRLWSLPAMKAPSQLVDRGNVLALAFDPKTQHLVSAGLGRNGVCLWEPSSGTCSTRLPVNIERVRALAVAPGGDALAMAGSGGKIVLWDLPRRIPTRVIDAHRDEVRALDFSSDGRWVASAGLDRAVHVFEAAKGAEVAAFVAEAALQTIVFVPQTQRILSGDRDGTLELWDIPRKERVARWKAHDDWVLGAAVSADAKWFASAGGDRRVRIWNAETQSLAQSLEGHESKVNSVAFSPDGSLVASAGEDKSVRVWDTRSGRELARLGGHEGTVRGVRFAPLGATLASGSDDGTIRLWNLDELRRPATEIRARMEQQFGVELQGTRVAWKSGGR